MKLVYLERKRFNDLSLEFHSLRNLKLQPYCKSIVKGISITFWKFLFTAKLELDIEEYSFSQTTLEQVFLKFSH